MSGITRLHAAIFLLSFLTLLFQFAQTRLFSATLDYHLTFLVLSGALLGVGAGATLAAFVDLRDVRPTSSQLAGAAALATVASLFIETHIDPVANGIIAAAASGYVLGIVPVLFVSWVIVRALRDAPSSSGSLYAADLAGAAAGAVTGYLAIGTLGDQGLYGLAAASALIAAALLVRSGQSFVLRTVLVVLAIASAVTLSTFGEALARPLPGPLKVAEGGTTHETGRWDPLARIDVGRKGPAGDDGQYAFLIDRDFAGTRPPALAMVLDMGALTPIIASGPAGDLSVFQASVLAAPYEIAPRPSVLVVGPGGGVDMLVALANGSTSVSAVEVNRTEVALMRGAYAKYSGDLYLDPRVHMYEDEARSFVRRSDERFDVIPITVVDSFAALSAGAYALTENYLYTVEAMHDFLSHLRSNGVVAMSRWYRDPPLEIARTIAIGSEALRQSGNAQPQRCIAVLRYGNFGLVLVRNESFTEVDMSRLRSFADAHHFTVAFDPLAPAGPLAARTVDAPPTDDRPYFFDTVPISDVLSGAAPLPYGYAVLIVTLIVSLGLALGGVLLPVYRRARLASGSALPLGTATAVAVGFGFIAAEVLLLQRLTLYLGQPSLALSLGLAALLAGASSGSALTRRAPGGLRASAFASSLTLVVVLGLIAYVSDMTLSAPLAVRVAIAVVAAWVLGVPLGTVLPRLIAAVGRRDSALVSWVWAANGTASVAGAVFATVIALAAGFNALGLAACGFYVIAGFTARDEAP